jgi:3-isopropylmalate/(R)-2-methylmalate dehydratase small subunit
LPWLQGRPAAILEAAAIRGNCANDGLPVPERFQSITAVAAPLVRANIDTDAIIPSREIRSTSRVGLADGLFAGWRYLSVGGRVPDPAFVLNRPAYRQARILIGGANFGCGSSREHAVWALREYGFRVVVAESFAPIFHANCARNGVLAVRLDGEAIGALADFIGRDPDGNLLTVDLPSQTLSGGSELTHHFDIDAESRALLLEGMDAIDRSLRHVAAITAFLERDHRERPWVYAAP